MAGHLPLQSLLLLLLITVLFHLDDSLCIDSSRSAQQLPPMPNVIGAKLVGIFEDDHQANSAVKETVADSKTRRRNITSTHWPRHNLKKRHFCDQVIFEEEGVRFVPTNKPSCMLGHDHDDHLATRRKRDSTSNKLSNLPQFFRIPAIKPEDLPNLPNEIETVHEDSYIKVKMRVCSEPGGEVLVFDWVTSTILSGFHNRGGSRQCNKWVEKRISTTKDKNIEELAYEKFISESNQIQIEYKLPIAHSIDEEYYFADEKHSFINQKHNKKDGSRIITYKSSDKQEVIFSIEVLYEEIVFSYSDPMILFPDDAEADPPPKYSLMYQPNSVKTYVLYKRTMCDMVDVKDCQDKFKIGITVEIERLDLDFDRGDYLLIGPGTKPEFWKNSNGQMIAQQIGIDKENPQQKDAKIWINADSAFIRMVTHNSLWEDRKDPALQFKWIPANTTLPDMKLDEESQMVKEASLQVCLMEYSCNYFKTIEGDVQAEAVRIFNKYLIANEKSITTLIDRDSVRIFDQEPFSYAKGHLTEQYCQFNLAISSPYDSEFPLVGSDVIRKMLFGSGSSLKMVHAGVTINNCEFERISWKSIFIPIAVILFVSISIMLVFWRIQNKMLENKNYSTNTKESPSSMERLHQPDPMARQYDDAMQY